jgi:hypothetical protein
MVMEYNPNSTSTVETVIGPAHQGNLFVAAVILAKPYSLSITPENLGSTTLPVRKYMVFAKAVL